MLHVKGCKLKHKSEIVFRYFASAVNSNQSAKCNKKDLYAICSYSSHKKVGYVPLYTFPKFLFHIQRLGFTLHSSSARLDSPCADSPDHRSVRNKQVKFICIYSLGPRFRVRCLYQRKSALYSLLSFFLKKIYQNFVRTLETVRSREVSVPRDSTAFEKKKNKMSKTVVIQTSETSQMYQDFCVRLRKTTVP